jgi:hypothetical protein
VREEILPSRLKACLLIDCARAEPEQATAPDRIDTAEKYSTGTGVAFRHGGNQTISGHHQALLKFLISSPQRHEQLFYDIMPVNL